MFLFGLIISLLSERTTKRISNRKLSKEEKFIIGLFYDYQEIGDCFEVIQSFPLYIRRFPPLPTNKSKNFYLSMQIGNYLNEIYILKQRLTTYSKRVLRVYSKQVNIVTKQNAIEKLLNSFDNIAKIRNYHVHQKRFSDDDLDRINLLEFLGSVDELDINQFDRFTSIVRDLAKKELYAVRKEWQLRMTENSKEIRKLLDIYFDILYSVVFDEKGNIIFPDK